MNERINQIDIPNNQDPLRYYTFAIKSNIESIIMTIQIKFDGTTFKGVYTNDELMKMDYFKHFNNCKTIEDKILEKINSKQYEFNMEKDSFTIDFKYPFDGKEYSVEVTLKKETEEEDLKKTVANLRDVIKKQQQEINDLKELFRQKDEYYNNKFIAIESKFDREELPEVKVIKEMNVKKYPFQILFPEQELINSWIDPNLHFKFNLILDSNIDGFKSIIFHRLCDDKGATVVIIETTDGYKFGGYTTVSWAHSDGYKEDTNSFIFSLTKNRKFTVTKPDSAIYCNIYYGPIFGQGHDILIANECNFNNSSFSNCGYSYSKEEIIDPRTYLAGSFNFTVKRLEVYQVIKN